MSKKVFSIVGLLLGIGMLISSGYFYFFSGKKIYSSDNIKINAPETSITKTFELKSDGNPYKIFMDIQFDVKENPKQNEYQLFTYGASIVNSKNQIIEQNSSSYIHRVDRGEDAENPAGKKNDTISLFTIKDIPSDTYALSIVIKSAEKLDPTVSLSNFSYEVKSNVVTIHPLLPITGTVVTILSYIFLQFGRKKKTVVDEKIANPQS